MQRNESIHLAKKCTQLVSQPLFSIRSSTSRCATSILYSLPRAHHLFDSRLSHTHHIPTAAMAMTTATAAPPSTSTSSVLLLRRLPSPASTAARCLGPPPRRARLRTAPQVSLTSDVSSSPDVAEEEAANAPKIGKRVRVTAPLRVYHVVKAPDLDIQGMEGVIKQYVGVWKGKRITANFPFKVEFQLSVEGQPKPVRLFVHLREDEFEFIGDE